MMNQKTELKMNTSFLSHIWPIQRSEYKIFFSLSAILFCILFNYTVLRDLKDIFIVTKVGAHAVPYVKSFFVSTLAALFVFVYMYLSNKLSQEKIFYYVVSFFLIFIAFFAVFLYPNAAFLQPKAETIQHLSKMFPRALGLIDSFASWIFVLFYVMAELWGSMMISLFFWQYANSIVTFAQSKRFYGILAVIGNTALIFSGFALKYAFLADFDPSVLNGKTKFFVEILLSLVLCVGLALIFIFKWMTNQKFSNSNEQQKPKKEKIKLSMVESLNLMIDSKELRMIAILVFTYGVIINLIEVQWQYQLTHYFKDDHQGLGELMGNYTIFTGIIASVCGLVVSTNILQRFSWKTAAMITPCVVLICGGIFFLCIVPQNMFPSVLDDYKLIISFVCVILGGITIVLSKTAKYTLFDPTKEMAYIPLDNEIKTKGKAAVDVIGSRLGKAGGGFIQMLIFFILSTKDLVMISPYVTCVFFICIFSWIYAVKNLDHIIKINEK